MRFELYNGGKFVSRGGGKHPTRVLDSDELICVLNGTLEIFEDDVPFTVRSGEWLFLRRGHRHGGLGEYAPELRFFWLHFLDRDGWLARFPQHGRSVDPARLADYALALLSEQRRIAPDPVSQRLLFQLMLREILRSSRELPPPRNDTALTIAADRYLRLHFSEAIGVGDVAEALACNSEYLGRLYHHCRGETVTAALNRLRIEHAAKLLADAPLSIKEVAAACGFNDPAYFRRKFRLFHGLTPGEFRRLRSITHCNSR